jgi:1,2-diacylglycerol 3-beta-galactosyltransferase
MENENKKKVLILTADAGMGHRSAAEALKTAFEQEHGDQCDVIINNPLDHPKTPKFLRKSQSNYDEIVKKLPDLYEAGYEISDGTLPVSLIEGGMVVAMYEALRDIVLDIKPDLILTTYPIYQAPLNAVLILNGLSTIPLIAVVTDLVSVHHVWFNRFTTCCAVPTEEVRQQALKAGLSPDHVILSGIPVNPQIGVLQQVAPNDLRKSFGWDADLTTFLVVGSPRVADLEELLVGLDKCDRSFQMILVAGGNDELNDRLEAIEWQHPVQIYNLVKDMPEMMRASDLIICKAGGLIVTESLAAGLPLMLIHALPGQEAGNVDYVVNNQAGAFCTSPEEIRETISTWLADDGEAMKVVSENACRIGKPNAAFTIIDRAWECLLSSEEEEPPVTEHHHVHPLGELLRRFNISHNNN